MLLYLIVFTGFVKSTNFQDYEIALLGGKEDCVEFEEGFVRGNRDVHTCIDFCETYVNCQAITFDPE